jgi:hypothetical protein
MQTKLKQKLLWNQLASSPKNQDNLKHNQSTLPTKLKQTLVWNQLASLPKSSQIETQFEIKSKHNLKQNQSTL